MVPDDPKTETFFERLKIEEKVANPGDLLDSMVMALIGGALAFWAYGTVAHFALFAFIVFSSGAVGNRISSEMLQQRAREQGRRLVEEHFEGAEAPIRPK